MRCVLKNAAKIVKECPITLDRFEKNAKKVKFFTKMSKNEELRYCDCAKLACYCMCKMCGAVKEKGNGAK